MPAENILVTFWSRTGKTEKLALSAALGAVQAKAKIRLRWLRESVEDSELDSIPEWRENRKRMNKEYIEPREDDFAWADGIVIAIPARLNPAATELKRCLHANGDCTWQWKATLEGLGGDCLREVRRGSFASRIAERCLIRSVSGHCSF
jgi:multimeric flavodoxin WrbA